MFLVFSNNLSYSVVAVPCISVKEASWMENMSFIGCHADLTKQERCSNIPNVYSYFLNVLGLIFNLIIFLIEFPILQ